MEHHCKLLEWNMQMNTLENEKSRSLVDKVVNKKLSIFSLWMKNKCCLSVIISKNIEYPWPRSTTAKLIFDHG